MIISANFGGFDPKRPYFQIDESTGIPGIDPDWHPRLKSRYCKTHIKDVAGFVGNADDIIVWIDGSVVPMPGFVEKVISDLGTAPIACIYHPDRKTLGEEYDHVIARTDNYVMSRYDKDALRRENNVFRDYRDAQMYEARIMAFNLRLYNEAFMNLWWQYILDYSLLEQTQFSALVKIYGMHVPEIKVEGLWKKEPHLF